LPRLIHSFPTRRSSDLGGVVHPTLNEAHPSKSPICSCKRSVGQRLRETARLDRRARLALRSKEPKRFVSGLLVALANRASRYRSDRKSTRLNSSHVAIS